MAANGNIIIDMNDPRILNFVSRPNIPANDRLRVDPTEYIKSRGMTSYGERPEPGGIGNFDITTYVQRKYILYRDGQIFGQNTLTLPLVTTLQFEVGSILGIDEPKITGNELHFISEAFSNYVAGGGEGIAEYTLRKLAEYKVATGQDIDTDLFDIFSVISVQYVTSHLILDKDDAFRNRFTGVNPPESMPPGHKEGSNLKSDGYSFRKDSDTYLTKAPPVSRDHVVEVPKGATKDDKLNAVKERAREDVKKEEACLNANLTEYILPIVVISIWQDHDWPLEWGYRKICGGGGMHCYWPTEYIRDVDQGIYASLYYPTADNREVIIRKVFEESLQDAAVIAMVTEDLNAALEAFKLSFFQRLKDRTVVAVKCIIPNFYAAEVHHEWRRA